MNTRTAFILAMAIWYCCATNTHAQSFSFSGQASAWSLYTESTSDVRFGGRYIPEVNVARSFPNGMNADIDLALNTYMTAAFFKSRPSVYDNAIKPYRAWVRLTKDSLEARIGLQKISFGSSTLFRPLMWFDRMDPRDPLQLTDGVYALLLRYTMQGNASVWLWGLAGNDTTGWETARTAKKSIEFGGRFQAQLGPGAAGLSVHYRKADTSASHGFPLSALELTVPETRFGIDGKWNFGIGAWFEAVLVHGANVLPDRPYQRQYSVGFDYKIATGDGLDVLVEYYRSEAAATAFGPSSATHIGGFSFVYPFGTSDVVSGIMYRDFTHNDTYRFLQWRTWYLNWTFYAMAFVNPDTMLLVGPQGNNAAFAGTGGQIMLVFTH